MESATPGGMLSGFSRLGRLPIPRVQQAPLAPGLSCRLGGKETLVPSASSTMSPGQGNWSPVAWPCWGGGPWVTGQGIATADAGIVAPQKGRARAGLWAGAEPGSSSPGSPSRKPPPDPGGHLGTCSPSWDDLGVLPGRGSHIPMVSPCPWTCSVLPSRPSPVSPGVWGTPSQCPKLLVPMGSSVATGTPLCLFRFISREDMQPKLCVIHTHPGLSSPLLPDQLLPSAGSNPTHLPLAAVTIVREPSRQTSAGLCPEGCSSSAVGSQGTQVPLAQGVSLMQGNPSQDSLGSPPSLCSRAGRFRVPEPGLLPAVLPVRGARPELGLWAAAASCDVCLHQSGVFSFSLSQQVAQLRSLGEPQHGGQSL